MGSLKLRDLEFDTDKVELEGYLYQDSIEKELNWSIDVTLHEKGFVSERTLLRPHFYDEDLKVNVRDWVDFEGATIDFIDGPDEDDGPVLYLFSHECLPRSHISFGERTGSSFQLRWEGEADAAWEDGENMPFLIEARIIFKHIIVRLWEQGQDIEAEAKSLLSRFTSLEHLHLSHTKRFREPHEDAELSKLIKVYFCPQVPH